MHRTLLQTHAHLDNNAVSVTTNGGFSMNIIRTNSYSIAIYEGEREIEFKVAIT